MHITDMTAPRTPPDMARRTQVRAVAALIAMGATDLLPVLFAPTRTDPSRGHGRCQGCGEVKWLVAQGRCRAATCRKGAK